LINKSGADLEKIKEKIKNAVEACIEELVKKFRKRPYIFYTEHDIHCYLYHLIYKKLYENRLIKECRTEDGKETVILHEEYPPIYKEEERRSLGHFDIVILNPASIKSVKSIYHHRNLCDCHERPAEPFIAIELALDRDTDHLTNDYNKLTNPKNDVKHGYILHFMRDIDVERRQKRKRFKDLLKTVQKISDEGKVKIWYLDNFKGEGIRKELKWK
jgi:hypothetical protein